MYRLIACDIDDTILDERGALPDSNRDALRRLHNRGVAVVLSTGRATLSARGVAEKIYPLTEDTYLLSFNGARVVTAASDTIVYEQLLRREVIADIASYARRENLVLHGFNSHAFLSEARGEPTDELSRRYGRGVAMERIVVDDLAEALPEGTPKLLIIGDHQDLLRHQPRIEEIGSGRLVTTFSKPHFFEILHPAVNKGIGLRHLAGHLGISMDETIAVGDNLNDLELLDTAGLGIAVANAHDRLKAVADVVLSRSAGDGAIEEIEERFF